MDSDTAIAYSIRGHMTITWSENKLNELRAKYWKISKIIIEILNYVV